MEFISKSKGYVLNDGENRLFFNACSTRHEEDVEKFRSEYMAGAAWFVDAKRESYDEDIAKQKAEDEKLIAKKKCRNPAAKSGT